jgi:DNA mismatch repair protein MutL
VKVRKLPEELIRKIAAGEVVERPSSVVKELVENSIDAGATRISVLLGEPMYSETTVSDDGTGMSKEDALLSLERYSTSKLEADSNLFSINTLGFRGEAIPSIAQVSRLTLSTRVSDSLTGTLVRCEAGKIEEISETGRPPGTTVSVKDLFFNTPVRRKFLRSRSTELRHVIRVVTSYALAFERIHFVLRQNERELLNLPPVSRRFDRVVELYGLQTAEQLLPVEAGSKGMRLAGHIGRPEASRTSGEHQLFWVNQRWVSSPTLTFGVREAYSDLLSRDRFPLCILMLDVKPEAVDVNVHPTKREVKFADEAFVRAFVRDTVRGALAGAARPVLLGVEGMTPRVSKLISEQATVTADQSGNYGLQVQQLSLADHVLKPSDLTGVDEETELAMVPLWQLHRTYILAQIKGGLVIIDQHAAHERVLYEEAVRVLAQGHGSSQQLLFPLMVDLSAEEFEVLLDTEARLRKLGFDIKASGRSRIIVRGIPAGLRGWREGQLLHDILDGMTKESGDTDSPDERLARSFACHAAVRAGEPLTLQEMNQLVNRLFSTGMPQGDPHGRLTFVRIPLEELERRLGRS